MVCDLLVFILQAGCEQTKHNQLFCDKEVVALSKVLETKVEGPQILSNWLALIKFSIQYLENLDNKISNPLVVVSRNK